jgi:hypothetical protein
LCIKGLSIGERTLEMIAYFIVFGKNIAKEKMGKLKKQKEVK